MHVNRLLSLFGIMLTMACDGAAGSHGPEPMVERRQTMMCVGVDSVGNAIVVSPLSDGTCAAGFDLRKWS